MATWVTHFRIAEALLNETDEFVDHTVRLLEETVSQRWNVTAEEREV